MVEVPAGQYFYFLCIFLLQIMFKRSIVFHEYCIALNEEMQRKKSVFSSCDGMTKPLPT